MTAEHSYNDDCYHSESEDKKIAHRAFLDEGRKQNQKDIVDVVSRLEERYSDRGLKFTTPFIGSVPVQAFGTIDDMIFYFRYRGDYGNLRIGFIREDRFELEYERDLLFYEERLKKDAKDRAENGVDENESDLDRVWNEMWLTKPRKQERTTEDIPTSIRKVAHAANYLDDPYNGTLTAGECEELFIFLMNNLQDVEHEENIIDKEVGKRYGRNPDMSKIVDIESNDGSSAE